MKIIIVGDGKVGHKLAQDLSEEDHDIVLIDHKQDKLKKTIDELDVNCLEGDGASQEILKLAGVEEADILIAMVSSDSTNLLCCLIANKLGAKKTIARVRNPVYYRQLHLIQEDLQLSMAVNPEFEAADEISRVLIFPTATKIERLARGRAEIVEYRLDASSKMVDLTLEELKRKYPCSVLICGVQRGDEVYIPDGSFCLQMGDKINILSSHRELEKFFRLIGRLKNKISSVMIGGGGRIAYYLARKLIMTGIKVLIVEKEKERCYELSDLIPEATIIHGDATNNELLLETGIDEVDAFVALTGYDEENIIMSMYAKSKQVSKIITKVNSEYLAKMVDEVGLDTVISPKEVTADTVSSYVRAMKESISDINVEAVYRLVDNRVEALEFIIREKTAYTGIPLKELQIKKNLLIACIVRKRRIIIPDGDTKLEKDDYVIVISLKQKYHNLDEIFM